jgi:hypothetical protein
MRCCWGCILSPGVSSLNTDQGVSLPQAENQTLGENGRSLIIRIAEACHSLRDPSSNTSSLVASVLSAFTYGEESLLPAIVDSSLATLQQNCLVSEKVVAHAGITHILALMCYRTQIERFFFSLLHCKIILFIYAEC